MNTPSSQLWSRLAAPLLVLGDVMLDRYVWGDVSRVSPEAPVPILTAERNEYRLGGAANVAHVLAGLHVPVELVGVVGGDAEGERVSDAVRAAGISDRGLKLDPGRATTLKERYVGRAAGHHPQQILRVDREQTKPLADDLADLLIQHAATLLKACSALLLVDYAKGVCTPRLLEPVLAEARRQQVPVLVDPPRGQTWEPYRGVTVLKPNRREAELFLGYQLPHASAALAGAANLCEKLELNAAVLTLDSEGLVVATQDGQTVHCATQARTVFDITGAGDTVMAVLALGVAAGLSWSDLLPLANRAAGRAVEQFGNARLSRMDLLAEAVALPLPTKVCTLAELEPQVAAYRCQGKQVVFTNGCFDLLHAGHVACLEESARAGDVLIVAVNDDASVRRLKGPGRPLFGQGERVRLLAALACVDHVLLFGEYTPHRLLVALRPDVLAKGGTYRPEEVVGREIVEGYGGKVFVGGRVAGLSTTDLLARIRS